MSKYYSLHATSAVGSFLSSGKLVFIIRVMKNQLDALIYPQLISSVNPFLALIDEIK